MEPQDPCGATRAIDCTCRPEEEQITIPRLWHWEYGPVGAAARAVVENAPAAHRPLLTARLDEWNRAMGRRQVFGQARLVAMLTTGAWRLEIDLETECPDCGADSSLDEVCSCG